MNEKYEAWNLFDDQGNIVSDEYESVAELIAHEGLTKESIKDMEGFTICRVLQDENIWYECLEEIPVQEAIE